MSDEALLAAARSLYGGYDRGLHERPKRSYALSTIRMCAGDSPVGSTDVAPLVALLNELVEGRALPDDPGALGRWYRRALRERSWRNARALRSNLGREGAGDGVLQRYPWAARVAGDDSIAGRAPRAAQLEAWCDAVEVLALADDEDAMRELADETRALECDTACDGIAELCLEVARSGDG